MKRTSDKALEGVEAAEVSKADKGKIADLIHAGKVAVCFTTPEWLMSARHGAGGVLGRRRRFAGSF